jgi:hypothetical protein
MASGNLSQFSASAHGPGYWFGTAAIVVAFAALLVLYDVVAGDHVAFWMPLVVAGFCLIQGVRSILLRREGASDGGA